MSVLITGGAGYIGSHTARLLKSQGREVVVLDTTQLGIREGLRNLASARADIGEEKVVAQLVEEYNVTAVLHFAAYKSPADSMTNPGRYYENNVVRGHRLLQTLLGTGVRSIVFSSSCSVYGTPLSLPVKEDEPIKPESPYGETKAVMERMLDWYSRRHDLRSVCLRYFNAAGAWPDGSIGEDPSESTNLVPSIMQSVLQPSAPPLTVWGGDYPTRDGTNIRDYVHVMDLARAHIQALDYLLGGGTSAIVNLGSGVGTSVLEVITAAQIRDRA